MAATESTKVQLTLTGPPAGQYEKGPMLNFYGESVDEIIGMVSSFFGQEVEGDLQAIFSLGRAAAIVNASGIAAGPAEGNNPQPAGGSDEGGGTCPKCGLGTLVKKFRRDGSGSFIACDQFPDCRYIPGN